MLLIFSQTFAPDPAAVGQYMADVATTMSRRGYRVRVYAARRGYEDAGRHYAARENMAGADIRRLPWCSFGKKNLFLRILGTASFLLQCFFIGLFTPRVAGIFFSTSPPMIGLAAAWLHKIRGVPVAYWAMDLNPDQLIAMGKIGPHSLRARLLERVNGFILKNASIIYVLDRYMVERLKTRGDFAAKMHVAPPWPRKPLTEAPPPPRPNPFREEFGLRDKFVFMYSGNHSPANPLHTLLEAAAQFKDDPQVAFVFVGGGLAKPQVDNLIRQHNLANVLSIPWQPPERLPVSLAAADVHLVSLGDNLAGVIHPCKIYSAMAAGRPILYIGPHLSPISDLLEAYPIGWQARHGEVDALVKTIKQIRSTPPDRLAEMGRQAHQVIQEYFQPERLRTDLGDTLAATFHLRSPVT